MSKQITQCEGGRFLHDAARPRAPVLEHAWNATVAPGDLRTPPQDDCTFVLSAPSPIRWFIMTVRFNVSFGSEIIACVLYLTPSIRKLIRTGASVEDVQCKPQGKSPRAPLPYPSELLEI